MRKWIIALAVMMVVPAVGAAATIVVPPKTEQLVEGHTVFSVIEKRQVAEEQEYAAAVAVLVREVTLNEQNRRFPGVLWFNDQYLVNPSHSHTDQPATIRYPCSGAILATAYGSPDPRNHTYDTAPWLPDGTGGEYVESYHITDPNNNQWDVDLWNISTTATPSYLWSVGIRNNDTGRSTFDDGYGSCGAYSGGTSGVGPGIQYNALLYFRLKHLEEMAAVISGVSGAPKDHTDGSTNDTQDASGCDDGLTYPGTSGVSMWPCPAGDDNREGNSHKYNPQDGSRYMTNGAGQNNHGGSADCDTDGVGDQYCHATFNVNIWYNVAAVPDQRDYWLFDVVGSTAPFHCHEGKLFCKQNTEEILYGAGFYDNSDGT